MTSSAVDFGRGGFAAGLGKWESAAERFRLYTMLQRKVESGDWDGIRKDTSAFLAGMAAGLEARAGGIPWPEDPPAARGDLTLGETLGDFVHQSLRGALSGVAEALSRCGPEP